MSYVKKLLGQARESLLHSADPVITKSANHTRPPADARPQTARPRTARPQTARVPFSVGEMVTFVTGGRQFTGSVTEAGSTHSTVKTGVRMYKVDNNWLYKVGQAPEGEEYASTTDNTPDPDKTPPIKYPTDSEGRITTVKSTQPEPEPLAYEYRPGPRPPSATPTPPVRLRVDPATGGVIPYGAPGDHSYYIDSPSLRNTQPTDSGGMTTADPTQPGLQLLLKEVGRYYTKPYPTPAPPTSQRTDPSTASQRIDPSTGKAIPDDL